MSKINRFKINDYAKIRKQASHLYEVKGMLNIETNAIPEGQIQFVRWRRGGVGRGRFRRSYRHGVKRSFVGPSLQQRLYSYAVSASNVTVILENVSFRGRVISVGRKDFELIVADSLNSPFEQGSLVTVNLAHVNTIATD